MVNKLLARVCASTAYVSVKRWLQKTFCSFKGVFYFLFLLLYALGQNLSFAEERSLPLTAAYIYYFTKFVTWPDSPEIKRICIASDNPLLKTEFEKIAQKSSGTIKVFFDVTGNFKSAENTPRHVVTSSHVVTNSGIAVNDRDSANSSLHHCQLIYLTLAFDAKNYSLLSNNGMLLVVENNMDFPEAAIHLVLENNKLVFDINRRNAKLQGLDISAKLLDLAREVKE